MQEKEREEHGNKKLVNFYLIDEAGHQHLAATGIDNGDAHYTYKTQPVFHHVYGDITSHNPGRKDVIMW
jgi:hypothetical protein